jgi:hypothetical protein
MKDTTRSREAIVRAGYWSLTLLLLLGVWRTGSAYTQETKKVQDEIKEVTKDHILKNVPNRFYFDYEFKPKPGKRYWRRIDDKTWIERYPDGEETTFAIIGQATVNDATGIIIQQTDEKTFQVFIPDKGSELMWLRIRHTGVTEDWSYLAKMEKVEYASETGVTPPQKSKRDKGDAELAVAKAVRDLPALPRHPLEPAPDTKFDNVEKVERNRPK